MKIEQEQVDEETVLSYFETSKVLDQYEEAARKLGLWISEELVFRKSFPNQSSKLLELGCGVGRISFSLWMLGYENITATDVSHKAIKIQIDVIRDYYNDGLTDLLIPIQEWLPRQPPMAGRTMQSNRQHQPARRQALK